MVSAATTSYAAGDTYYRVVAAGGEPVPFPSLADAGYLAFYRLMLAALIVAVNRQLRGLTSSVWLDAMVGSLGAAAVLAVVLRPVLDSALMGAFSPVTLVAVAPPMFDVLLVATVAGIAALPGGRTGGRWGLLAGGGLAGLTLLAAAVRSQLAFRLLERMAHLRGLAAATDELAGLPNRRALYAEGHLLLADPQRRRQALPMLDLDKFKEVNDSLGHRAGDQLLVQVGARLSECLRAGDLLEARPLVHPSHGSG